MVNLACRIAALAVLIAGILHAPAVAQTSRFAKPVTGSWGFDLSGADFATKPGDDFFHYANGAWYDRAIVPPDRTSNGVSTALTVTAEARTRDILESTEEGSDASTSADAAKIRAFYAAFMNQARAQSLDDQPIAPLLGMIRI